MTELISLLPTVKRCFVYRNPDLRRIVGLQDDGSVVAIGTTNSNGQCEVSDWTNVITIDMDERRTIALRTDGTVYDTLGECANWSDIVDLQCVDMFGVFGLRADGTVVFARDPRYSTGDHLDGLSEWSGVKALYPYYSSVAGLFYDGTVLITGEHTDKKKEAENWTDIVQIWNSLDYVLGLKVDGTFVFAGDTSKLPWTIDELNAAAGLNRP